MRVNITCDEWYPVFSLTEGLIEVEVDLDEEFLTRVNNALKEFEAVQVVLAALYEAGTGKDRIHEEVEG